MFLVEGEYMKRILQPHGWSRPKGYANGIAAEGTLVFTAGIIGWNEKEEFESDDFAEQFKQALLNTLAIIGEANAEPEDIVRMTCFVTSKREYLENAPAIGAFWRETMGKMFPCMSVIEVTGLVEDRAKIEIETTAVVAR